VNNTSRTGESIFPSAARRSSRVSADSIGSYWGTGASSSVPRAPVPRVSSRTFREAPVPVSYRRTRLRLTRCDGFHIIEGRSRRIFGRQASVLGESLRVGYTLAPLAIQAGPLDLAWRGSARAVAWDARHEPSLSASANSSPGPASS